MKDGKCIMSTTSCIIADNNYLYIVGVLAFIAIIFIFFIYFKSRDTPNNENTLIEGLQKDHNKDSDYECDGDKCFIKHKQTNKSEE
jgi:phosphotransferase system  glucose/maltose/N-acetylglucosamine-specific IIC component